MEMFVVGRNERKGQEEERREERRKKDKRKGKKTLLAVKNYGHIAAQPLHVLKSNQRCIHTYGRTSLPHLFVFIYTHT